MSDADVARFVPGRAGDVEVDLRSLVLCSLQSQIKPSFMYFFQESMLLFYEFDENMKIAIESVDSSSATQNLMRYID